MKRLLLFALLLPALLAAQSLTVSGPANVKPGQTGVVLSVNLAGSAGTHLSAVQVTVGLPAGFTVTSSAVGAAATTASKSLTCSSLVPGQCLVWGLNQTMLADGVLFTITGNVAASVSNALAFTLTGSIGASLDAKAVAVAVAPGPSLSLPLISPCDINADGAITAADILAYLNSFVYVANPVVSPACDLNGDGACNVVDIQRIATAGSPGGVCLLGP